MTPDEIESLERVSVGAYAVDRQRSLGGWLVLVSEHPARRLNCVYPLGEPGAPTAQAIEASVAFLHANARPAVFKLAYGQGVVHPLDEPLERAGYTAEATTEVLTRELTTSDAESAVDIETEPGRWFDDRRQVFGLLPETTAALRRAITPEGATVVFATVERDGAVAQGQAVTSGDWIGIFSMFTEPRARRLGLARQVLSGLLAIGAQGGARRGYLQVEVDNGVALGLYRSMGFTSAYRYHYRREPAG